MPHANPVAEVLPQLLTQDELAKRLNVARRTVVYWRQTRGLPCLWLGARPRFVEAEVLAWLRRGGAAAPAAGEP